MRKYSVRKAQALFQLGKFLNAMKRLLIYLFVSLLCSFVCYRLGDKSSISTPSIRKSEATLEDIDPNALSMLPLLNIDYLYLFFFFIYLLCAILIFFDVHDTNSCQIFIVAKILKRLFSKLLNIRGTKYFLSNEFMVLAEIQYFESFYDHLLRRFLKY